MSIEEVMNFKIKDKVKIDFKIDKAYAFSANGKLISSPFKYDIFTVNNNILLPPFDTKNKTSDVMSTYFKQWVDSEDGKLLVGLGDSDKGFKQLNSDEKSFIESLLNDKVSLTTFTPHVWADYFGNGALQEEVKNVNIRVVIGDSGNQSPGGIDNYLDVFVSSFIKIYTQKKEEEKEKNKDSIIEGGVVIDDDLKNATYNSIKNLYDKWVGGSSDGKIFNNCISSGDHFIESFAFVDRFYYDIGDIAVLNPEVLSSLTGDLNRSLLDVISRLLSENNFIFQALPVLINFNKLEDLIDAFKPQPIITDNIITGPTFVCVYTGGNSSKSLNISSSTYGFKNDGFDIVSADGTHTTIPNPNKGIPTDKNISAFLVGVGHNNQSIFKSISMNQEEYRETDESLSVISSIFDKEGATQRMYKGANLFNVYNIRSYTCDVESLGNMVIQPLMYFQLSNVPLFHGAYLITKVSHEISPQNVMTKFKGYRQNKIMTPIVTDATTFIKEFSRTLSAGGDTTEIGSLIDKSGDFYKKGYNKNSKASFDGLNKKSNTKITLNDGTVRELTFLEIFESTGESSDFAPGYLIGKISLESGFGRKESDGMTINSKSGASGIFQFTKGAAEDSRSKIERDRIISKLTDNIKNKYGAKKINLYSGGELTSTYKIKLASGNWGDKTINRKDNNDIHDDLISTIFSISYAKINVKKANITFCRDVFFEIYMSHQQGRGGYLSMIRGNKQLDIINSLPKTSRTEISQDSLILNNQISEITSNNLVGDWSAAWAGILDRMMDDYGNDNRTSKFFPKTYCNGSAAISQSVTNDFGKPLSLNSTKVLVPAFRSFTDDFIVTLKNRLSKHSNPDFNKYVNVTINNTYRNMAEQKRLKDLADQGKSSLPAADAKKGWHLWNRAFDFGLTNSKGSSDFKSWPTGMEDFIRTVGYEVGKKYDMGKINGLVYGGDFPTKKDPVHWQWTGVDSNPTLSPPSKTITSDSLLSLYPNGLDDDEIRSRA